MKIIRGLAISLVLLTQAAAAQSLGDLARKERERRAKEQKAGVAVTTDELQKGQVEFSPPLDPARKGDLDYLLEQLAHPRVSLELLAALISLKDRAIPRLLPALASTDPLKRVAPATVLIVIGNTEGLGAMARLLGETVQASARAPAEKPAGEGGPSEEAFRQRVEVTREADYALTTTKLGVWRFGDSNTLTPDQVVQRLQKGPAIEVVGGPDNGQRLFSRALRDKDPNVRLGAIALIRLAADGKDFGFQPDQAADRNASAIQEITTFLTTERGKVISELGTKAK